MKKMTIAIMLMFVLILSGCGNSAVGESASEQSTQSASVSSVNEVKNQGTDYTIKIGNKFDTEKYAEQMENPIKIHHFEVGTYCYRYNTITMQDLYESSTQLVRLKIKNVYFAVVEHASYTVYNAQIIESYKGELLPGDLITIYEIGGYSTLYDYIKHDGSVVAEKYKSLPVKEQKQRVVEFRIQGTEPPPKEGEEYIIGLSDETLGWPMLAEGTYTPITGHNSTFKLDENNKYTSFYGYRTQDGTYDKKKSEMGSFTLEWFENKIDKIKSMR